MRTSGETNTPNSRLDLICIGQAHRGGDKTYKKRKPRLLGASHCSWTIPMEKKSKKAKWLSGEALQIAVKRREVKSKGEKERHKHLNAEFQRIARRDKKAFFSDQCKEIEEKKQNGKD